jgi:hypothetical protein
MSPKYIIAPLSCFCLLLLTLSVNAQKKEYTLKGYMGVQGGESFHYDMQLKDSVGNLLSGYSSTYQIPENDVKTYVVAELDRTSKTLRIKESTIIHNNYFQSRAIICLVDALLKYSALEKNLYGKLITMTAGNGANCSNGSISFSNKEELDQLFNTTITPPETKKPELKQQPKPIASAATKITPDKPLKVIYDTAVSRPAYQPPPPPKQATITEGKGKMYEWHSDEIVMEIWDGNTVDNDQIKIAYNGNEILKSYVLTKDKKELRFPVGGNELNIISITAINEGSEPPNTANIIIKDGDISYDIMAYNNFGKTALIKIKKKI